MKRFLIFIILSSISAFVFAQNTGDNSQIKADAKLKRSVEPFSNVITTIRKGETVNIISIDKGYYYVNYKGEKGYISEIFFKGNWDRHANVDIQKQQTSTEYVKSSKEMKVFYKDNIAYMYYVHNGISVTLTVHLDNIYGKCYVLNLAIENFTGKDFMFYPDDTHIRIIKNGKRKIGKVISYYDFMKKVRRKQTWNQVFMNISESMDASQAGHSYSSTSSSNVSGSYTQSAAVGGVAGFYGNNYGAAVGTAYGESTTVSTSTTNTNTHNYNGTEAYYARQNAQKNINNYANQQYQIRQIIDDGYLKTTTIRNEERLVGIIAAKYEKASELEIEVTVNFEKYTFNIR